MSCFFCCKILPKEETFHQNDDEKAEIVSGSNLSSQISISGSDNSKLNSVANQQSILQISSYLHIPRNEIDTEKQKGSLKEAVVCCQDCQEISDKLGNLCGLLEITQLKINYYLNLLTDQILKKDGYLDHQQINLSKFQKTFHQKCLTKLAKIDPNPVLQLTKCIILPVPDNSPDNLEEPDSYDDDNDNVTSAYIGDKPIKVQNYWTNHNHKIFSCDLCPMIFNNLANKSRHIKASHLQKKTSSRHLIKPCEYCGAMMSTRHLSVHKKNVHGIGEGLESDGPEVRKYQRCSCGQTVRVKNMGAHKMRCKDKGKNWEPILTHKERPPVKCDICEKLISYQNISAHKRKVHGILSNRKGSLPEYLTRKKLKKCEFCGKMVSCQYFGTHQRERCGGRGNKKGKGDGDEGVEENSLVKCCEFCGKGVLRERIDEHERLWCEVKKRMVDLEEMERGEREENLKCEGCGVIFEFGRDLRCHLKESEECREGLKS